MPSQLASGSQTAFWWHDNVTPAADMREWVDPVRALRHLIDRYCIEEVRRWPIEVWNEPNVDIFWEHADRDACIRLHAGDGAGREGSQRVLAGWRVWARRGSLARAGLAGRSQPAREGIVDFPSR
jgi:hypothetical protein